MRYAESNVINPSTGRPFIMDADTGKILPIVRDKNGVQYQLVQKLPTALPVAPVAQSVPTQSAIPQGSVVTAQPFPDASAMVPTFSPSVEDQSPNKFIGDSDWLDSTVQTYANDRTAEKRLASENGRRNRRKARQKEIPQLQGKAAKEKAQSGKAKGGGKSTTRKKAPKKARKK